MIVESRDEPLTFTLGSASVREPTMHHRTAWYSIYSTVRRFTQSRVLMILAEVHMEERERLPLTDTYVIMTLSPTQVSISPQQLSFPVIYGIELLNN